jgi:ankyrin repeat protein
MSPHRTPSLEARRMGRELLILCQKQADSAGKNTISAINLINAGAHIEESNEGGTCLIYAAFQGHDAIVDALLRAGANKNARDIVEATPLISAACGKSPGSAKLLIAAGADLDAQDKDKKTALINAVLRDQEDILAQLLAAGAATDIRDFLGRTAADIAEKRGKKHFLEMIREEEQRRGTDNEAREAFRRAIDRGMPSDDSLTPPRKIRITQPQKRGKG